MAKTEIEMETGHYLERLTGIYKLRIGVGRYMNVQYPWLDPIKISAWFTVMTNIEYRTRDQIPSPYEFLGQKIDDNPMKPSAKNYEWKIIYRKLIPYCKLKF